MGTKPWQADKDVVAMMEQVKERSHQRLKDATIAVSFKEAKPFTPNGRFNWGKTSKFSDGHKMWHDPHRRYDFEIQLPTDGWHSVLKPPQREAWLDIHLTRCTAEYVPATVEENGKVKKIKDKWGRVEYTDQIRLDDEGNPIWKIHPFDLHVFADNARRYGLWCEDLLYFKDVLVNADRPGLVLPNDLGGIVANADVEFHPNLE